ncbi:hypothetical protein D3C84_773310 [compost metagenome]
MLPLAACPCAGIAYEPAAVRRNEAGSVCRQPVVRYIEADVDANERAVPQLCEISIQRLCVKQRLSSGMQRSEDDMIRFDRLPIRQYDAISAV